MSCSGDDYCEYFFQTHQLGEALNILEKELDCSFLEIDERAQDCTATIIWRDQSFRIPIFAFPQSSGELREVEDQQFELTTTINSLELTSGIFAPVVECWGRSGRLDGTQIDLMHMSICFDIGPRYARITLDFFSGQRFGDTEESPRYMAVHNALIDLCDYCLIGYDYAGIVPAFPPFPKKYWMEEYLESEVELAANELIAHHSGLPSDLLEQWPVPVVAPLK